MLPTLGLAIVLALALLDFLKGNPRLSQAVVPLGSRVHLALPFALSFKAPVEAFGAAPNKQAGDDGSEH